MVVKLFVKDGVCQEFKSIFRVLLLACMEHLDKERIGEEKENVEL